MQVTNTYIQKDSKFLYCPSLLCSTIFRNLEAEFGRTEGGLPDVGGLGVCGEGSFDGAAMLPTLTTLAPPRPGWSPILMVIWLGEAALWRVSEDRDDALSTLRPALLERSLECDTELQSVLCERVDELERIESLLSSRSRLSTCAVEIW